MIKSLHHSYRTYFLMTLIMISCVFQVTAQKPKKLLANGYYEQAFLDATKKQNKKVKIKAKHTNIILKSYNIIYEKGNDVIASSDHDWKNSYNTLIRVSSFRSKVKHPGVNDKLKNILTDENVLGNLIVKYNLEYERELYKAVSFEFEEKYFKAMDIYNQMKTRQDQAQSIAKLKDRLRMVDVKEKIDNVNQKIGDQYIEEAKKQLYSGTKANAKDAIDLINKAKTHRPLNQDEEELLTLANLILRNSWMQEAKNLLNTKTKRNGRLAYELINKTRSIKTLTTDEEFLLQHAKEIGMTKIRVIVKGKNPIHTSQNLSGILNKEKSSDWITFYGGDSDKKMDFDLEINENNPRVVLGDIRKRVEQRSKKVEYYEEETNSAGQVVKVKKTKNVIAMVAILSRTKWSYIEWSTSLIDKLDGKSIFVEAKESKVERTNEFASVESGDILALPENIESDISLDSQPFPSDKEMSNLVTQLYLKELRLFLRDKNIHLQNIDLIIE